MCVASVGKGLASQMLAAVMNQSVDSCLSVPVVVHIQHWKHLSHMLEGKCIPYQIFVAGRKKCESAYYLVN